MKIDMYGEIMRSYLCSKYLLVFVIINFVMISPILSQINKSVSPEKNNSQEQIEYDKWKNLSEEITNDTLADIKSHSFTEQPIILAHLAELWWKVDNERAKKWLKKAVSEVTFEPITETELERQKRFEMAGKLTEFTVRLYKQLAKTLIEDIADQSKKIENNQTNADGLVKTALQIVKFNPVTAKELGSKSLSIGQSYLISRLIGELNVEDSYLADRLFSEAIANSKVNLNKETNVGLLSSLATLVLNNYKGKPLSERSKRRLLTGLFVVINANSSTPDSLQKSCNYIFTASNLIKNYQVYFPEKAIVIRQKAESCKRFLGNSSDLVESNFKDEKPQTIDDYLKAAADTEDKLLKKNYFYRAIEMLYRAKEYERIISVLDNMNEESRAAFSETSWSSWRRTSASKAAVDFAEKDDFANVYRIINNTPKMVRPFVQMLVAQKFTSVNKSFAIALLNEARKEIHNSLEIEDKAKAGLYISLLRLYSEVAPYDALNVFREMVKAINKADENNPDNEQIKDYAPNKSVVSLPISLLKIEEFNSLKILSEIKSEKSRIRFRLGFLEQSLKELEKFKSIEQKKESAQEIYEENS